jgi:hypothetical protein
MAYSGADVCHIPLKGGGETNDSIDGIADERERAAAAHHVHTLERIVAYFLVIFHRAACGQAL